MTNKIVNYISCAALSGGIYMVGSFIHRGMEYGAVDDISDALAEITKQAPEKIANLVHQADTPSALNLLTELSNHVTGINLYPSSTSGISRFLTPEVSFASRE